MASDILESVSRSALETLKRFNTSLWFERHGAVKPRVGPLLKAPDLHPNCLQLKINDVSAWCLQNNRPCRIIILKPRQELGSSTFSVATAYRWLANARATGCMIGGAFDQSEKLFRMLKTFAENDTFGKVRCAVQNRIAKWSNGSLMDQYTANNPEAGRSGTFQVIIATEVARWAEEGVANAADVLSGLLMCVANAPGTLIIIDSTANGATGDYYERWQGGISFDELKQGQDGYVKIFAAWFEAESTRRDPALEEGREQCVPTDKVDEVRKKYGLDEWQIAWMQWAVREQCKKDFDVFCEDYPFDPESAFRTSGRRRFNQGMLQKMVERARIYQPDFGNIDMVGLRSVWRPCVKEEARVVRWEQPKGNCRYLVSVDSMTGETQVGGKDPDNHAVGVLRAGYFDPTRGWVPPKIVSRLIADWAEWERSRKYELRWDIDVLENWVWRLAQYYGNCLIVPEVNMDRGLIELLKLRGTANIYVRHVFNKREQTEQKAYGWKTDPSTREMIIENLARAIREQGKDAEGIDIFCPITLSELQTFIVKQNGRSEAMPGKKDDCVLQTAIGLATINGATVFGEPITEISLPPDLRRLEEEERQVANAMKW